MSNLNTANKYTNNQPNPDLRSLERLGHMGVSVGLPLEKLFYLFTACHITYKDVDAKFVEHKTLKSTQDLMTEFFPVPGMQEMALTFFEQCPKCTSRRNRRRMDSRPDQTTEPNSFESDPIPRVRSCAVEGILWRFSDDTGEVEGLTKKIMANIEDVSWTEMTTSHYLIVSQLEAVCSSDLIQHIYNSRLRTISEGERRSISLAETDCPRKPLFVLPDDVFEDPDLVNEFLDFLGIGFNLETFSLLDLVLKMHNLLCWRSNIKRTLAVASSEVYQPPDRVSSSTVFFVDTIGPYGSELQPNQQYLLTMTNMLTRCMSYFYSDRRNLLRKFQSFLRNSIRQGIRIHTVVLDRGDILYPCVIDLGIPDHAIVVQTSNKVYKVTAFIEKMIDLWENDMGPEGEVEEFVALIVGLYNRTFNRTSKTYVASTAAAGNIV